MSSLTENTDDLARFIYGMEPAVFNDKVDGISTMGWLHAEKDRPQEYLDAYDKAKSIQVSKSPQAELIKLIGKESLLGEVADFVWYHGSNWLVKTRFGNFHWKDPDYSGGDNSFTFFEGNDTDFSYHIHVGFGRDKGRNLVLRMCGPDIELKIPQLD